MNSTKHTTLSNQIQHVAIKVKQDLKGSHRLTRSEREYIEALADELSLRLPISTTLYYRKNDPMNPLNEMRADDIIEWIDREVHVPIKKEPRINETTMIRIIAGAMAATLITMLIITLT